MHLYDNIPQELKELLRWVNFSLIDTGQSKLNKFPINPRSKRNASIKAPNTWCSFQEAYVALGQPCVATKTEKQADGTQSKVEYHSTIQHLGHALGLGVCGLDIDHVMDENGMLFPETSNIVLEIVGILDSYTEISASGTGLHILFKGECPVKKGVKVRKGAKIDLELYSDNRFFIVTGNTFGEPKRIEERTEQIKAVYEKYIKLGKQTKQDKPTSPSASPTAKKFLLSDDAVIIKASSAKNGDKFKRLWSGDTSGYDGDDSAADQALCNILAFWTNGDLQQVDRLFRQSGLMRGKWDEMRGSDTYGNITIATAMEGFTPKVCRSSPTSASSVFGNDLYNREYIYLDNKNEYKVAVPLLANYVKKNMKYIFARSGAKAGIQRYMYSGGVYQHVSDDEFKGYIKREIPLELQQPNTISNTFTLLTQDTGCYTDIDKLNADENIINFQNGIFRFDTMSLIPHSPDILSTIQIPCNYNPNAERPANDDFMRFLIHLCHGERDRMLFLLEFMGVALSNIAGYRMKKALFMVGPGDTGKSQCKELLNLLIGKQHSSGIDLSKLEARFGASNLYGKRIAGSNDMKYATIKELETFKQLTGGDAIETEYKGENLFSFKYRGILWFCMNECPKFGGDRGDWVYNRIIVLECSNPVLKKDPLLLEKMYAEREYIVNECVKAAKRVIDNGHTYDIPDCCLQAVKQYKVENNSVLRFLEECTEPRGTKPYKGCVNTGRVYAAYKQWCGNNTPHGYWETMPSFRKVLQQAGLGETHKSDGGRYYEKFVLTDEARQELSVFDNGCSVFRAVH